MFTEQNPTLINYNVMNRKMGSESKDRSVIADSQHMVVNYNPQLVPW